MAAESFNCHWPIIKLVTELTLISGSCYEPAMFVTLRSESDGLSSVNPFAKTHSGSLTCTSNSSFTFTHFHSCAVSEMQEHTATLTRMRIQERKGRNLNNKIVFIISKSFN